MRDGIDYVSDLCTGSRNYELSPFEELRMAVIKQAAFDYKEMFNRLLYGFPMETKHWEIFDECEAFFYSNQFDDLVDIDGEYIMNRIATEARKKKNRLSKSKLLKKRKRAEKEWKELKRKENRKKTA